MQHSSNINSEKVQGIISSVSPTVLPPGIFSLIYGGIPQQGALAKIPGKNIIAFLHGAVWSIAQFGSKVVVQNDDALVIYDLYEVAPGETDIVTDNSLVPVTDSFGIQVLA